MDGKRKVTRSNYRWYAFKMKWLVPNWERAVGPAFWLYRLYWWWKYPFHDRIDRAKEWWNDTAVKWLTPHLANARRLFNVCVEDNGTKLLNHTANYFYIRTRDENQYYFEGKVNLLGKVTITRTQWVDGNGDAKNLFLYGVVHGLCGEPEKEDEKPVPQTAEVFNGYVLTKRQLLDAVDSVMRHGEFGWDSVSVAESKLCLRIEPNDAWTFCRMLDKSVLDEHFPGVDEVYKLDDGDYEKFGEIVAKMSVEEAKRRVADET